MASSLPDYIRLSQPFAISGNKSTIPQTATGTNSASFQEGFPPITSQPLANGGMPPLRTDFNALGYVTTSTLAFLQQGGVFTFDTSISNLIGGYAQGAILNYTENGKVHKLISLVNNNTYNFNNDPSYIGQYWDYVTDTSNGGGGKYIGEVFAYPASEPPEGAYLLNGQTIYNCSTLYPDFWAWLQNKIGEMETVAIYKPWTMPALTADGTLGGSEYAVEASRATAGGNDAYKSFDRTHGGADTFSAIANTTSGSLTFYSPVKLKITSIFFKTPTDYNANYYPVTFEILGSNNGTSWTSLVSGDYTAKAASAIQSVDIPESKYGLDNVGYQYLKIEAVNGGATNLNFPEIIIYGQEYVRTKQESKGYIRAINAEEYETEIAQYGFCGAFVVSENDVRLPLWKGYQTPLGDSVPVKGNGITLGLTDGTNDYGVFSSNSGSGLGIFNGTASVGTAASSITSANNVGRVVGIPSDPTKSGIIADTSGYPKDGFTWCIQVFNAATELSTQESAQLASQMQMKAQTDLANTNSNIDFVVESWNDDAGNWYRLYRSGWLEQGGVIVSGIPVTVGNYITLFKPFKDTNYTTTAVIRSSTNTSDVMTIFVYPITTTSFQVLNDGTNHPNECGCYWRASGYTR